MKALVKREARQGVWLEDVPMPVITENDVLIKVHKAAICGTDVHIYKWDSWAQKNVPVPLVIGHEFVGTIAEVGKNVHHLKIGERVSAEGHLTCGTCINCMIGKKHLCPNTRGVGYHTPGCFAEYMALPAENIFKLPDTIDDEIAAIFDPFGNSVHTALTYPLTAEDVLITGAGPIGLMAVAIAKQAGARNIVITDVKENRLEMAKRMGATAAVNVAKEPLSEAMKKAGIREGFTVGLEMSGNPGAFSDMLKAMRNGGNIALLGIFSTECAIDWDLVIFKMLNIKGIYGREIFSTWYKMTSMIESGLDLTPIITHRLPFEKFEEGFQAMISGDSGKVILTL